jgi:uncharacterized protein YkwD
MNILSGLPLLLFFAFSCVSPYSPPATTTGSGQPTGNVPEGFASEMLDAVNEIRQSGCKCGSKRMPAVAPLKWNSLLEKASDLHAEDMRQNNFFDHKGSDKSTVGTRSKKLGYQWNFIGENIAKGPSTVKQVMSGWINSPSHCRNMMDQNYREMGAAKSGSLWVQVFGKR